MKIRSVRCFVCVFYFPSVHVCGCTCSSARIQYQDRILIIINLFLEVPLALFALLWSNRANEEWFAKLKRVSEDKMILSKVNKKIAPDSIIK